MYGLSLYLVKKIEGPDDSEGRAEQEQTLVLEQTRWADVLAVKTEKKNDAANTHVMKSIDESYKTNVARPQGDKDTGVAPSPDTKEGRDGVVKETTVKKT